LRPQHSLFQYFTKLLEQYTKVLIPPKDVMRKLEEESKNEKIIRQQVNFKLSSNFDQIVDDFALYR
jgi:splicing factor 3A subunit 1